MRAPVLLCVDESPYALQVRKASLEPLGFAVVTVTSGPAAIAALEKLSVDAVLLEHKLEGMDAEAIAFHLKRRFPRVPIVLLSAFQDMPEPILWLVDEYMLKSELLDGLARVLERVVSQAATSERKMSTGTDRLLWRAQQAA